MSERRNIVLISFDDAVAFWKYKTVFGAALQTPNLDRICAQSTAFHAAYCQAPVCSPSRASFMSGQSPHQSGITGATKYPFDKIPAEKMWPFLLRQGGYFTSSGGKMMSDYKPLPEAEHAVLYCDERKLFRKDWAPPSKQITEYGGFRKGIATLNEAHDHRFYDFRSSKSAISFLWKYKGTDPFYREVGFYGPHGPWITPRRYKDMYEVDAFEQPKAWVDLAPTSAMHDAAFPPNFNTSNEEHWRKSVRNYFSAMTHVDYHLGRVWDVIKASHHADNTVVIITSDHGLHLGDRQRIRKGTLWEQVANVPLIIHDPQLPVGSVVTDPVGLIDIGPTVLDYAGLPPLKDSPGRSLRPYCEGDRDPDRAVPTFSDNHSSIRQGRYRFIRYEDGSTEVYDIGTDWWQTRNLGTEHPEYERLQAAHVACCLEYGLDVRGLAAA